MALQITGNITSQDIKLGDGVTYVRLIIIVPTNGTIVATPQLYKNKVSYKANREITPVNGINEILPQYIITDIPPTTGIAAMQGKSIADKFTYWVHEKVMAQIIAANPTFTLQIQDIDL